MAQMERMICPECEQEVAARVPRGGDGSALRPRRHPHRGLFTSRPFPGSPDVCPGSFGSYTSEQAEFLPTGGSR